MAGTTESADSKGNGSVTKGPRKYWTVHSFEIQDIEDKIFDFETVSSTFGCREDPRAVIFEILLHFGTIDLMSVSADIFPKKRNDTFTMCNLTVTDECGGVVCKTDYRQK